LGPDQANMNGEYQAPDTPVPGTAIKA